MSEHPTLASVLHDFCKKLDVADINNDQPLYLSIARMYKLGVGSDELKSTIDSVRLTVEELMAWVDGSSLDSKTKMRYGAALIKLHDSFQPSGLASPSKNFYIVLTEAIYSQLVSLDQTLKASPDAPKAAALDVEKLKKQVALIRDALVEGPPIEPKLAFWVSTELAKVEAIVERSATIGSMEALNICLAVIGRLAIATRKAKGKGLKAKLAAVSLGVTVLGGSLAQANGIIEESEKLLGYVNGGMKLIQSAREGEMKLLQDLREGDNKSS